MAVKLEISTEAFEKLRFLAQITGKSEGELIEELLKEEELKVKEVLKKLEALKELQTLSKDFKGVFKEKSFQEIKSELFEE